MSFLLVLLTTLMFFVLGARSQPNNTQQASVIDNITIKLFDHAEQIDLVVDFSVFDDNPFYFFGDFFNYGFPTRLETIGCLANKLEFTDGITTFTPKHPGYCHTYTYDPTQIVFNFDNRDLLHFILAGFASKPYPNLTMHTNNRSSEGNFPAIAPIPKDDPIIVSYAESMLFARFYRDRENEYFMSEGIMLVHFPTFIRLSSLNLSQALVGTRGGSLTLNNSRTLADSEILTQDFNDLAITVALRLNSEVKIFFEKNGICTDKTNCALFYNEQFARLYNGYPVRERWQSTLYVWNSTASEPV